MFYTVSGQREGDGTAGGYCGPQSQCNAVGGTLEDGTACQCDVGNARIDGICVAGETAGDCEEFEEYANTEDTDRTEGACRPRVVGDCTGSNEEFTAATDPADGGTCTCISNYGRNSDGICVLNASFHQACYDADFREPITNSATAEDCRAAMNNPEDIAVCAVIDPDTGSTSSNPGDFETVVAGSCSEDNPCGSRSEYAYLPNALTQADRALVGQCATRDQCLGRQRAITAEGHCRLAQTNADCALISEHEGNPNTPIHDTSAESNCRAPMLSECESTQALIDGVCTTCDSSMHERPDTDRDECVECSADQHLVSGSCEACPMNQTRALREANCSCPTANGFVVIGTACQEEMDQSDCTDNQLYRSASNTCTPRDQSECPDGEEFTPAANPADGGTCTRCLDNEVSTGGAACACNPPNVEVENECRALPTCESPLTANDQNECHCPNTHFGDADSCVDFLDCADPLDLNRGDNTCFCNSATHFEETDGSCVAHADCTGEGANVIRNTGDNTCVCANNYEGEPGSCTACVGEYLSENGADCACPPAESFDAGEGVCEASLDGTCTEPRDFYNPVTNACECPTGQRLNADETACEAIPASSDGGSSNGAVIALVAVPAVLIGGYWLLGGFDYIDPAYGLDYSGKNSNLEWRGNAGFNLRHGGLRSYASAIQSNGDAVSYESGISYERDFLSLTYDAAESESEYLYDFEASMKAEFGLWAVAPAAVAEFQYQADEEAWRSDASASLRAAWTAHKWTVRAQSAFAGNNGHTLDLELKF